MRFTKSLKHDLLNSPFSRSTFFFPVPEQLKKNSTFSTTAASAQQQHPLTNIPEPLEGVATSVWFPKHTGAQFEAGELVSWLMFVFLSRRRHRSCLLSLPSLFLLFALFSQPRPPPPLLSTPLHHNSTNSLSPSPPQVEVIVGFRNSGPTPANVSFVVGSLNSAADFSAHFQNFTALRPAGPVVQLAPNGGDASVSYRFQLAPNLPEYAFQVALTAFLDVEGETIGTPPNVITIPKMHAHTFFNRTVDVVEPSRLVDWQLLQMVVTLVVVGGAVGWVRVQMAKNGGGSGDEKKKSGGSSGIGKKVSSAAASVSASSASKPAAASSADDWLKGTNIGGKSKKKKA